MAYRHIVSGERYSFPSLARLLAKATPSRSGDELAGIAAESAKERIAAQMALADLPIKQFLSEAVVAYESDEVTRLIVDSHDAKAFAAISHLTVGELRDFLLSDDATGEVIASLKWAFTPEMAAAVSKIMRVQDLVLVARKIHVVTRFRTTVGLPGRLSTRLQPNHPTDDARGIAASMIDGLMLGSGDAVIGINPVSDNGPADDWRRAPMPWRALRAAAGQYRRRLHRAGISLQRQADHPGRAGGPFLRQAARPADGVRYLLHQPCRSRSGRYGLAADAAGRGRRHFIMGVPGADDIMLNYQSFGEAAHEVGIPLSPEGNVYADAETLLHEAPL
jgi:ethanolamine ammonia-lyase large subunit